MHEKLACFCLYITYVLTEQVFNNFSKSDMMVSVNNVVEFPGAGFGRLITINSAIHTSVAASK